ncbi:Nitrogen regulation protein C [Slackia heliotrinireducens]|uniref:Response regulator containing a CheY-like receiver domain and an HTH DNA-binding domain n=1 Tax=Slackia heliotrinireducens (strain ATCC 29202 / DSM 20476 / NCTC 11029 / RHS 1) TaxID=471855 RepID=C7N3Z9_SLAHD|nr:LuxR C-terminal-related transcriptional regulator [Slackia heliotrinireducens]ACV21740.1 response regulator containing a CheY-like receiver domain and an HTH DNA-binding domain [Slackia heliotrinireducens DSM 20476]VEG99387.1 Nitrogen regulation protein C [Slackia heliotrinireducens]
MQTEALRPHISMLGYAMFMVINATQAWGGVFPFLPASFQTEQVTIIFYLAQSIAFFVAFASSTIGVYFLPGGARRMLVFLVTSMIFLGSSSVIAAMYVPAFTMAFVVAGGVLLGVGCAGGFMLWQRYFASADPVEGNFRLLCGSAVAAVLYMALYLVPNALTAFLIPVVMLPICALAFTLCVREMDFQQPMFEDVPRQHPQVYVTVIKDFWPSAVAVAALGFASGLARGVAVLDAGVNSLVNSVSMVGLFLAAVGLLFAWRTFSIRFDISRIFTVSFPILALGLLVFPFMQGMVGLSMFAGMAYMLFSIIVLAIMMQSAQISRDRGINPVFAYGFFGSYAYGAQGIGFVLGWIAYGSKLGNLSSIAMLSLFAMYMAGMALFLVWTAHLRSDARAEKRAEQVELIKLTKKKPAPAPDAAAETTPSPEGKPESPVTKAEANGREITDRMSKQCLVLQEQYGLSTRETEVMEAIARGMTVARIAEDLFISENTVRTHSKHIYTKLDIHSKQELTLMVQNTAIG